MGHKKSAAVKEKRKPVKVRPIERKHAGKVTEPYRIMEAVIKEHHAGTVDGVARNLEHAKIILLWRKGWKPDVDKVLKLGSMKLAGEVDRAIGSCFGDDYDFAMQLNEDAWPGLSDDKKRHVLDHELCHAAPDLDRDGNQKLDAKERLCWRARKHPIQEFPEIVGRYGVDECLGLNALAQKAVEDADRPLLAAAEQAAGEFRSRPVDALLDDPKVKSQQIAKLHAAGVDTLGELADLMDRESTWWHKHVPGIGKDTAGPIEDALAAIRGAS